MSDLILAKDDPFKPENLSDHNRDKFKGTKYRYTFPTAFNRKVITLEMTYEQAKATAIELNKIRDSLTQETFEALVEEFSKTGSAAFVKSTAVTDDLLRWREEQKISNPITYEAIREDSENKETHKRLSWNMALRFAKFCDSKRISTKQIDKITILNFWNTLSVDVQKKHKIFVEFLDWVTSFNLNTQLVRWDYLPASKSGRLHYKDRAHSNGQVRIQTMDEFWTIYHKAGQLNKYYLQDAMLLALYTTLREGDVLSLRRDGDAYDGKHLRKSVLKSINQKGEAIGTNLYWDLNKHTELAFLLKRMEQRAKKLNDCPYFVCHQYLYNQPSKQKDHPNQVLNDYLQHDWTEVRDSTNLWQDLPIKQRPGFNEIRSLSATIAKYELKYVGKQISASMAHTDPKNANDGAPITHRYTDIGHKLQWTEHTLVFGGNVIRLEENMREEIVESKPSPTTWKAITPIVLQRLLWTKPVKDIAADYGVCDSSVHNKARELNLIKPKAGFWNKVEAGLKHQSGEINMEHAR